MRTLNNLKRSHPERSEGSQTRHYNVPHFIQDETVEFFNSLKLSLWKILQKK